MTLRESTRTYTPAEWFDVSDVRRRLLIEEACREARANFSRITIRVKDRFGSRVVTTVDARFWTFNAAKDVDLPVPNWHDLQQAAERRKKSADAWERLARTRKKADELGAPSALFEDD